MALNTVQASATWAKNLEPKWLRTALRMGEKLSHQALLLLRDPSPTTLVAFPASLDELPRSVVDPQTSSRVRLGPLLPLSLSLSLSHSRACSTWAQEG